MGRGRRTRSPSGDGTARCTVIVCTRNRPECLNECLASLHAQRYRSFDVLVVDNGSDDRRTYEVARRWQARYVASPLIGLSRARNHGASVATTELIAFIDDDAVAHPGWLGRLVDEFTDASIAVVAGRILPFGGDEAADPLARAWSGEQRRQHLVVDRSTPDWFAMANFGGIGDGGNMAFRRDVHDTAPLFVVSLGRGAPIDTHEEHFAFYSLIERGYRIAYTPDATVFHPSPSGIDALRARRLNDLTTSAAYMTFLLFEATGHRLAVVKYVLDFVRGAPRSWRPSRSPLGGALVPRWRVALALLRGPVLYGRAVWSRRGPISRAVPHGADVQGTSQAVGMRRAARQPDG
jgi:glycosyltransferase involved in cell wall biosynthesis